MRAKSLIIGATLLFAPLGCGTPRVGDTCEADERECHDDVGYYCEDGKWKSQEIGGLGCDCWLDGGTSGCAVIGYIGVTESGRDRADPQATNVRRLRRSRRAAVAA